MADPETGRLLWRCRRGMKELDLVLTRYLAQRWPDAGSDERARFEQILELPDPLLAGYLMGREQAPDPAMQQLVEHLRCGIAAPVAPAPAAPASRIREH